MTERAQSPASLVRELVDGYRLFQAVYVVAKLGIADLIGDEPRPIAEIAAAAGADEDALYRVMRALAGQGVFHEGDDRTFSLTPAGQLLRSDNPQSLRNSTIYRGEENYDVFRELLYTVRTGRSAFERVFGAPRFEYYEKNKEANAVYQAGMQSGNSTQVAAIVDAYDFAAYRTVVDVGGGDGALLSAVLSRHPDCSGILFDRTDAIEWARSAADGTLQACQFVSGDFFEEVPLGGDLYILKSILHNWSDEQSVAILGSCRRAMGKNGKLLLVERVVGPANEPSATANADLNMLVVLSGKERRKEEFEALLGQADFELDRVINTRAGFSLLEARPVQAKP